MYGGTSSMQRKNKVKTAIWQQTTNENCQASFLDQEPSDQALQKNGSFAQLIVALYY